VVRRFLMATALAALAAVFTAPAALAQYDYGSESGSGTESASNAESNNNSESNASTDSSSKSDWKVLSATLTGEAEKPKAGDTDGTGRAVVKLKDDQVCFELSWSNIAAANLGHIHRGTKDVAGPPVVNFFTKAPAKRKGCVTADKALVARIAANPAGYYVNIHNKDFPAGAIRGQLSASNGSLPFTGPGDSSQRLLWIGALVTVAGAGLLIVTRRLGVGRHLATAGRHLSRR
jgi:CHRD domain